MTACALWTAAAAWSRLASACSKSLLAGEFLRRERLLPLEFQLHLLGGGLRRGHLRLGLVDIGGLGDDLAADTVDRRLLGGDFLARRVGRKPVVAVVDGGDQHRRRGSRVLSSIGMLAT